MLEPVYKVGEAPGPHLTFRPPHTRERLAWRHRHSYNRHHFLLTPVGTLQGPVLLHIFYLKFTKLIVHTPMFRYLPHNNVILMVLSYFNIYYTNLLLLMVKDVTYIWQIYIQNLLETISSYFHTRLFIKSYLVVISVH